MLYDNSVEQRFNELLLNCYKSTPISFSNIKNIPHYLIGSEDTDAQQIFYGRPEILSIYSANINTIFNNQFPISQDIFNIDFAKKIKIGFSKTATIYLVNEIAKSEDKELKEYLVKNLTLMNNKISLLWLADRLNDDALNMVLKAKHYKVKPLEQRFLNLFLFRLNKSKKDCSEELKEFIIPYLKDFQKKDYATTIITFIENKNPEKLDEYKKLLNIKDKEQDLVTTSTNLISVKLNKEELYKTIKNIGAIDKNEYWNTLGLVEKFLTKEKKKLGINYCLLSGFNNTTDSFNLIVETNEKFKMNPEMLASIIPKIFELYFDHTGLKLSDLEIKNANSIVNYHVLNQEVSNNKKSENKLKI